VPWAAENLLPAGQPQAWQPSQRCRPWQFRQAAQWRQREQPQQLQKPNGSNSDNEGEPGNSTRPILAALKILPILAVPAPATQYALSHWQLSELLGLFWDFLGLFGPFWGGPFWGGPFCSVLAPFFAKKNLVLAKKKCKNGASKNGGKNPRY
jgi:hypothetical protein